MQARMTNPAYLVPGAGEAIQALLQAAMRQDIVPQTTLMLAARGSQINACLHADTTGARKAGVTDDQLATVAAWRQSPFFTDAERAALKLAEGGRHEFASQSGGRAGDEPGLAGHRGVPSQSFGASV